MNRFGEYSFECNLPTPPLGELHEFRDQSRFIVERNFLRKPYLKGLNARQYLSSIESYIPEEIISPQNYAEMKTLTSSFTGRITSFFGFETRLNNPDASSDYLFAVSSMKGEREALRDMLEKGCFPIKCMDLVVWQRIRNFTEKWTNPDSILYNNVFGLWLEFDRAELSSPTPIPCIFIQTPLLRIDTPKDIKEFTWLTTSALPLLTGHCVSKKLEKQMKKALKHLPKGVGLMDVGVMLSRPTRGVRFCLVKIKPQDVIPYLTRLGWSDKKKRLTTLLKKVETKVTRVVLHITITEEGIDKKIGIECSFSPNRYHLETQWTTFLDYLIQKGACLPEKKEALLSFCGVEQENTSIDFDFTSYQVSAKIQNDSFSSALVRFISHIKIIYTPDAPIEAIAYFGVRLFGNSYTSQEGAFGL
jgi:hypothetical protein